MMRTKDNTRRIVSKLRSRAGETITETLVALLIAALALTMLAGAIYTGQRIIENSRARFSNYYIANEEMVKMKQNTPASDSKVTTGTDSIKIQIGSEHFSVNVDTLTNSQLKKPVTVYKIKSQ